MNGGDSDTDVLIYRWSGDKGFTEYQRLPCHGGEDAKAFEIDGECYLAVACIRSGSGPYDMHPNSNVYRWRGGKFEPYQDIPTFAAKGVRSFGFDGRHFLVFAAGVAPEFATGEPGSTIYEWSGEAFEPFQTLPSVWAYDWEYFEMAGHRYLGLSDHVSGMVLHRWEDSRFEPFQSRSQTGARDMVYRDISGTSYIACANLTETSEIHRWDGEQFVPHQSFEGAGGRRFRFVETPKGLFLIRINFIAGTREDPMTALASQVYVWRENGFELVESFPTHGGTDVAHFRDGDDDVIVVSNSLSDDVRFRTDSFVYRFG